MAIALLREAEQLALDGADLGEGEAARELRVLERELVRVRVRAGARASYCSPVVEWRGASGVVVAVVCGGSVILPCAKRLVTLRCKPK